jgi:hypothetical protein
MSWTRLSLSLVALALVLLSSAPAMVRGADAGCPTVTLGDLDNLNDLLATLNEALTDRYTGPLAFQSLRSLLFNNVFGLVWGVVSDPEGLQQLKQRLQSLSMNHYLSGLSGGGGSGGGGGGGLNVYDRDDKTGGRLRKEAAASGAGGAGDERLGAGVRGAMNVMLLAGTNLS